MIIKIFSQLLDLIYKKKCYLCGQSNYNLKICPNCYNKIELLPLKIIKFIKETPVYSATLYKDDIRQLIKGLKYKNQKELAFYQAKIMYDYWSNLEISKENFTLLPVPLHKDREKKRKYNHMKLVAQEFSKMTGYKINENLMLRIKNTKPQYKLTIKQRAENMKNAFIVNKDNTINEKILIIDDILTTGSTLSAIIQTFQENEIYNLCAFVTSCTEQ